MDSPSPKFMGLASLGLEIAIFCDFLHSVLILNAILWLDFSGLALTALSRPQVPADEAARVWAAMQASFEELVDRAKTSAAPVPVVVVGGGAILVGAELRGASELIRPLQASRGRCCRSIRRRPSLYFVWRNTSET